MKRLALILSLFIAGCASYPVNPPLDQVGSPAAYRFDNFLDAREGPKESFIVLSLSGGGMRATALAYGVIKKLDDELIPGGEETLLDRVNVISAVSGGSYTAAYYGLYGKEKLFRDFGNDFMYRRNSWKIFGGLLLPWNLWKIAARNYGRGDYAASHLDRTLYKGHTFADLPRKWPLIVINTTDMSLGTPFSFTQDDFDRICSDLDEVTIARAVMASSAFPGAFTPLTFNNYPSSQCQYTTPDWVEQALREGAEGDPEIYHTAKNWKSYEDSKNRPYLHFIDGGIADNLAVRPVVRALMTDTWDLFGEIPADRVKRVVIILVDAKPEVRANYDKKAKPPGLASILLTAATKPLGNYTIDTIETIFDKFVVLRAAEQNYETMKGLCDELLTDERARDQCYARFVSPTRRHPPFPELYFIHVRFDQIEDEKIKKEIGSIETDLQLSRKKVDLLILAGQLLLEKSGEYHRLLRDLGVEAE